MMKYGGGGCTFNGVLLESFTEEMMFEHKHKWYKAASHKDRKRTFQTEGRTSIKEHDTLEKLKQFIKMKLIE